MDGNLASNSIVNLSVLLNQIRVVHGSDGPAGRVGSRFCQILAGRVSTSDFLVFLLIISRYLNRHEPSNTTFGLIDFPRYLSYNI